MAGGYGTITEIKPEGSNSSYVYPNDSTAAGNNFYQLKMNDLDGAVHYSSVIIVKCESVSGRVSVGPNPFSAYLQISIVSAGGGLSTLILYDAQGRTMAEKKIQMLAGNDTVHFDGVDHLPAGVYYLQIVNADKAERFKLVKTVDR